MLNLSESRKCMNLRKTTIILFSGILFAQVAKSQMIMVLNDPSAAYDSVSSIRNDLVQAIGAKDQKQITLLLSQKMVVEYSKIAHDSVQSFYNKEKVIAWYYTGNYNDIIKKLMIPNESKDFIGEKKVTEQSIALPQDNLFKNLTQRAAYDSVFLLTKIESSDENVESKDFLKIFLRFLILNNSSTNGQVNTLMDEAENFMDKYPDSKFNTYIEENIHMEYETSKFGLGGGVFLGYNIMQGKIGDYFQPYMLAGGHIDISYRRFMLMLNVDGGFGSKVKQSFIYDSLQWKKGLKISSVNTELKVAYSLIDNHKFRIIPYFGVSATGISSVIEDDSSQIHHPDLNHFPAFNAGVSFDLKMKYYHSTDTYKERFISQLDKTYRYLRVSVGYMQPGFEHTDNRFPGNIFYIKLGLGMFSNPAVMEKHAKAVKSSGQSL